MAHGKSKAQRETRERAQRYAARTQLYEGQQRRKRRDNVIASLVGGVLVLAAVGAQVAYYGAGPGVAVPEPSPTTTQDAPEQTPEPLPVD